MTLPFGEGDVTATDDLEDFRKVLLTGRSNLTVTLEGVAPNGGRTDLLLVRDSNNNGQIDRNQYAQSFRVVPGYTQA